MTWGRYVKDQIMKISKNTKYDLEGHYLGPEAQWCNIGIDVLVLMSRM